MEDNKAYLTLEKIVKDQMVALLQLEKFNFGTLVRIEERLRLLRSLMTTRVEVGGQIEDEIITKPSISDFLTG